MKLIIDRKTWLRGEGSAASFLRRSEDGKQCCLGFYCRAVGLSLGQITDNHSPWGAAHNENCENLLPGWLINSYEQDNSLDCQSLMDINDEPGLKDREEKIKEIFALHDVQISFKGE